MRARVMHWDINAEDAGALREFYSTAFDWEFADTDFPSDYRYLQASEGSITGGIGCLPREGDPGYRQRHSGVTFYIQVDDLEEALRRVEGSGGRTIWGPEQADENMSVAMFEDPEGNRIGLMQHSGLP